jgi:hypothetical protein
MRRAASGKLRNATISVKHRNHEALARAPERFARRFHTSMLNGQPGAVPLFGIFKILPHLPMNTEREKEKANERRR